MLVSEYEAQKLTTFQTCKKCDKSKPLLSFSKWYNNGRVFIKKTCSTCKSIDYKLKYRDNTNRIARVAKEKYNQNKAQMRRDLMNAIGGPFCTDCKFSDTRALAFHLDASTKLFDLKFGFTHSYGYETMLTEAKKCIVLCINCHTKKHISNNPRALQRQDLKRQIMVAIGQTCCQMCKLDDVRVMSFHHLDPSTKEFIISAKLNKCYLQLATEEAKKCQVLCLNCHFIIEQPA